VTPESRDHPFWTYADLALFAGAILPSFGVGFVVAVMLRSVLSRAGTAMVLQFGGYALWFAALGAILRYRHNAPFWESLRWRPKLSQIGPCLLFGPILSLVVAGLSNLAGQVDVKNALAELMTSWPAVILVGVFATTLGPVCEELAFRGFLQPLVTRSFGPVVGILVAALPFALVHGPQYGWSAPHVALIGLAGAAFGVARHRTGSTAASTALHATYNLAFLVGFVLTEGDTLTW
jgi:membrane protease YdiL (CAAX protease family)